MASVRTFSEVLDSMAVATWRHMKKTVVDQIFEEIVFYNYLRSKGKIQSYQGGKYIETPLSNAENDTLSWINEQDAVNINDLDPISSAQWDWKYLVASVTRSQIEEQKNRGKMQLINLLKHKMQVTKDTLVKELESKLFSDVDSGGKQMEGLQHLIADDGVGTVGGINATTYTWWKNKFYGYYAGYGGSGSSQGFGTAHASGPDRGIVAMRDMIDSCSVSLGNARPDIILTDKATYRKYNASIDDKLRIITQKVGDMSFQTLTFEGLPILNTNTCPTSSNGSRMYFIDCDHVTMFYDPGMFFDMTEWKPVPNQLKRAAQIVTATNMITTMRRSSGVIFDIY